MAEPEQSKWYINSNNKAPQLKSLGGKPQASQLLLAANIVPQRAQETGGISTKTGNVGLKTDQYFRTIVQFRLSAYHWSLLQDRFKAGSKANISYLAHTANETIVGDKLNDQVPRAEGELKNTLLGDEDPFKKVYVDGNGQVHLPLRLGAGGLGNGMYPKEVLSLDYSKDSRATLGKSVVLDVFGLDHIVNFGAIINYVGGALRSGLIKSNGELDYTKPEEGKQNESRTHATVTFTRRNSDVSPVLAANTVMYLRQGDLPKKFIVLFRDVKAGKAYHDFSKVPNQSNVDAAGSITSSSGGTAMGVLTTAEPNKGYGLAMGVVPNVGYGIRSATYSVKSEDFKTIDQLAAVSENNSLSVYGIDVDLETLLHELAMSFACSDETVSKNYFDLKNNKCVAYRDDVLDQMESIPLGGSSTSVSFDSPSNIANAQSAAAPVTSASDTSAATSTGEQNNTSESGTNALFARYVETVAARRRSQLARARSRSRSRFGKSRRTTSRSRSRSRSRTRSSRKRTGKSPARKRKSKSRSRSNKGRS